jgi:hypothetical protein
MATGWMNQPITTLFSIIREYQTDGDLGNLSGQAARSLGTQPRGSSCRRVSTLYSPQGGEVYLSTRTIKRAREDPDVSESKVVAQHIRVQRFLGVWLFLLPTPLRGVSNITSRNTEWWWVEWLHRHEPALLISLILWAQPQITKQAKPLGRKTMIIRTTQAAMQWQRLGHHFFITTKLGTTKVYTYL